MSKPKILTVEDQPHFQVEIQKALESKFQLVLASSIKEALIVSQAQTFELFLLDLMLGDGDGFSLLTELRKRPECSTVPAIFLSANDEVNAKILGFTLGAEDYITKPFNPLELSARVEARTRKYLESKISSKSFSVGDFNFYLDRMVFEVKALGGNQQMDLTPIEFKLVHYFAQNVGRPLSREDILVQVWGKSTHVLERSVDTYVAALRKKLGPWGGFIRSVHGVGYKLLMPTLSRDKVS